jgi:endonuclease/exonuclease/phosphatase family metal-dependent hydrolase
VKVISWNVLRRIGATVEDVAALIEEQQPDLLLLQEATTEIEALPGIVGGHFHRVPLPDRIHGLAAWSPHHFPPPKSVSLPVSRMPGRLPLRIAQLVRLGGICFANVHLSHGQLLNRLQLTRIARRLDGPAAVIGDYNAFGPIILHGFRDVGPREATHIQQNILRFRLDRCLVHKVACASARILQKGRSDHHPIVLDLRVEEEGLHKGHGRRPLERVAQARLFKRGARAKRSGAVSHLQEAPPSPS